jgi:hypothetical protein
VNTGARQTVTTGSVAHLHQVILSMSNTDTQSKQVAALDSAHVGDMEGAFGTIRLGDEAPRTGTIARCRTLLAIIGPGLIVMVGDNDAGAFGTYTQAGQNYGTSLLWVLRRSNTHETTNRRMANQQRPGHGALGNIADLCLQATGPRNNFSYGPSVHTVLGGCSLNGLFRIAVAAIVERPLLPISLR